MSKQLVEIIWVDSCRYIDWESPEDKDYTPGLCRTVGYVVEDLKSHVALASSVADETGHVCQVMSIPRAAVRKIRSLR